MGILNTKLASLTTCRRVARAVRIALQRPANHCNLCAVSENSACPRSLIEKFPARIIDGDNDQTAATQSCLIRDARLLLLFTWLQKAASGACCGLVTWWAAGGWARHRQAGPLASPKPKQVGWQGALLPDCPGGGTQSSAAPLLLPSMNEWPEQQARAPPPAFSNSLARSPAIRGSSHTRPKSRIHSTPFLTDSVHDGRDSVISHSHFWLCQVSCSWTPPSCL